MRSETRLDSRLFGELLRSLLKDGVSVRFSARGRSMYPAISDGDTVQVESAEQIRRGEVVMVASGETFRVHRVVESGEGVSTQGDCCFEPDGAVRDVMGSVSVVRSGAVGTCSKQTFGSRIRRRIARWRGHF